MMESKQSVMLTGSARHGVGPHVAELAPLPLTVRLGRVRPAALPSVPRLGAYFDPALMAVAPPASTNRRDKAAASLARMYRNDVEGDCVIAGKLHAMGLWSAADADSPGEVIATDQEAHSQYVRICGPGDRGCVITQVLDVFRARGLTAGGRTYKIDGYVAVDHADALLVKVALVLFGTLSIGINLPEAWTQEAVWDATTTRIVGGHDVTCVDYDDRGVYVASWGRVYLITWRAFTDPRWVEEAYCMLAPLWYGDDRVAPSGVDVGALRADLDKLSHGLMPDLPDVRPPVERPQIQTLVGLDQSGKEVARYQSETP